MLKRKNLLYITDYDFQNDQKIKPRYVIVVDDGKLNSILFTVVTSKDYVPENLLQHGCVKDESKNIHCHIFLKDISICENGFSFPLNSFIYINSSSTFIAEKSIFIEKYNKTTELKDVLSDKEFENLIYCVYKSKFIPRGIKRILATILEEICM
jgi:hypothetical protein